jgi:MFS family permease
VNAERYRIWWSQRWVPQLFLVGLLGRLPLQMYSLAVLLLVRDRTGSFAVAGAVTASGAVGYAAAAPALGRLVDRRGQTLPLRVAAAVSAGAFAGLLAAALAGAGGPVLAPLAALAGLSLPPIAAAQRTLWSSVLPDPEIRQTALTVDSMTLDLGLIVGPLIVTGIAAVGSPAAALVTTAAMLLVGSLWFSRLEPSRRQEGTRRRERDMIGPLRSAGTRTLVVGATLTGVVLGALRVGFVALGEDHGSADLGGVLISVFGVGSLVGGLVYGARTWAGSPARRWVALLGCYTLGLAVLAAVWWSLPAVAVVALVAGSVLTPQVVTEFELIPACAPPAMVTEAYAWSITATFAGDALGTSLGGALVDTGTRLPLLVALGGAALATVVGWTWRHTLVPSHVADVMVD